MKKRQRLLVAIVFLLFNCSGCCLFTPLARIPKPADFGYIWSPEKDGALSAVTHEPKHIYGMGLTYAAHMRETGFKFDPHEPPPVFMKSIDSLNQSGASVKAPQRDQLIAAAEKIEPGLGEKVARRFKRLSPLLDYEGELAFVLLEDIDWEKIKEPGYIPKLGYAIANDISARTLAILGEKKANRYDYWGASKSFPGFLPIGNEMWVPSEQKPDSIPKIEIITRVNGEIRQKESTSDMMYTPREMLLYISKEYPDALPEKGDIVLMGTPGGVAFVMPAWKAGLADILDLGRFTRLLFSLISGEKNRKYLRPGDVVEVSGGMLGTVRTGITGQ